MTAEEYLNSSLGTSEKVASADDFLNEQLGSSTEEPEPSGFLRQAADIPIQFAKGVGSAVRGYTDLFGADNEVSKSIAGYEDYMDSILSAESKKDSKRVAELLQKAQDGGFLDKVAAGFEAFASAPAEMTANTLGYMVPQVVLGVAGKAAQLSKAAQVGLTIGTGFAQGVGMGKGNIYQGTKDYLREQGIPEDQVETLASQAQEYGGKNLDQILVSGGLNALAASTGAEAILTRVLSKQGKEASGGIIKGILKGAGAEAPIEGVQSAQEAIAPNIALQREGFDVPTFRGAIESATTGVVAGGLIGGAAGAIEAMSPEQKALIDIEKESTRRMRDLDSDTPAAQALSTEITRLERGIDNKRQDLDALESTSPEASSLRLDIAADQKKLSVLKTEAPKFGLSEPITEAERQQAELAKAIVEEPAPTEPLPVPPAQAAPVAEAVTPVAAPVEQVVTPPVEVAPTTQALPSIPQTMDALRTGTIEGLYTMLFDKLNAGDTTELGKPSKVLIDAMPAFKSGIIKNPSDLKNWVNGDAKMREDLQKIQAAPVEPTTPALVTEQAAPAEAPAPKVAPTPTEYKGKVKREYDSGIKAGETATFEPTGVSAEAISSMELDDMRKDVRAAKDKSSGNAMVRAYRHGKTQGRVNRNAPVFAEAVESYGVTLPEGYTKQGELYVYQPTPAVSETITKPKLGEKGGVLIPTKEDFIQAGQNIYEAGMEFGAWAKQMIQRFGDAVREFLGEVWQAVSGLPAKLEELAGYLPGKGEVGAVNIGRGKIGEKAKPSEEAEAEEKTTVKRGQVASIKNAGAEKKTPKQIIARTKELLRQNFFNPSEVTEQNTLTAFRALGKLVGNKKEAAAYAEELNDIGRLVDEQGVASEVSMGAILFTNDLFEYSIKLAAEGQKMMLGIMMSNMNKLPLGEGITLEESARAMRGALERSTTFTMMGKAEQDAYINYVAEFMYGPNPTKEQIQSIKDAYSSVDKTKPITEEELTDELEDVGKKTGTDLVGKIKDEIAQAAPPTQNPIVSAMLTLQKLYGGTIETRYTEARESAQKIKEGVKKILTGGISNYRGKMVEGAASGLESGFWKTLANTENKPGPLGELDAAQNRELGNIVKNMLISIGLKGAPPNTKMDIYEQVASILGEKQLSKDKIKLADEKIRGEINRKRAKEIEDTDDSDAQDAINLKYNAIEHAWDEAMARQLDMPISGSMLRRLIFNELKEDKTSVTDLAKLMNDEPVIGASRQDRLVNSIITKIAGVTFEGQNPADYSALKEYLGNQLEALILEKQTKAKAARAKEQLAKDAKGSVELQAERAENEAQSQIERLAKIQSDTPSFPAEAQMNPVREAVKNALKLSFNLSYDPRNEPDAINNLKKNLALQLQSLGVKEEPATILASVVARQVEINSLNNKLKSIDRAIEKGPISEIVKAIKETPLEDQQKPNWRYEVMRDYLRRAGLPLAQAERIAKLMDISLQKRFTMAQEQAFTDAISKSAPWKTGDTRSRRAFQKVFQALRAGALDPARNVLSDMAALNGWTGFTPEQYKALLKNDAILSDPKAGELKKAEAYKAIQDVISKAKLPIRARNVIGQYYDAQALSGIPTLTVNAFSPIAFAMRNAIIEIGSGTLKGNPKAITNAATALVDSIKSWANTVAFSFKNNVTVYSNVDYIVNDDNLLRLYRRGVDQFKGGKTARDKADGVKNMMVGMMDYVRRILNALDYGAIASLQNQNISKYSMAVMKRQGMSTKEGNEMFAVMMKAKNDFYLQQIAIGTDKNKASILADEYYVSSWGDALTKAGVEKSDIKQAMDAAINDALSAVGRNRQSLDSLKDEATKLKDAGVSSMPALWLLESMANAANQSDNQILKLFSRVIYGFAIVPARVIRETAWFSPYGFVRFGYDAIAKKMGKTSPYAQSLGTDVQYSQRLNEAIAGTVALIALASLRGSSTDEPEEDEFKIVFTGNGPKRIDDPQFYDSWYKAGNKPNSMIVSFGKTKIPFNMMRGFEAFTWPAMMLGAVDDLEIRKKQKRDTNTNTQIQDASIVAGFVFDAALRRGPYAFTTKSLFGTYGDIGVEGVAKGLTFPAKTLIPVLGTSLASNLSNFINDPIDRRTLDGAVWSNIPFIGPAVAPKSLNAFGEPALSTDFASKMFKLGVPLVYDIPTDRESIKLHELVLKQGGGPSIPTRNQLAQRLDRQPTNKEYEMFVKEYGAKISSDMKRRYEELSNKTPEKYSKSVEKIGNRARDIAERKVRLAAKKP